jgi:hypothetical protein
MSRSQTRTVRLVALGVAAMLMAPAMAHHSYAMFDRTKSVSLSGKVRIWEFTNPHSYLWVYVKNDKGDYDLYGLEAPGPAQFIRAGWNKNTVKPGDSVTVLINPLSDGRNGGNLVRVTLADGRTWSGGAQPLPNAGEAHAPSAAGAPPPP